MAHRRILTAGQRRALFGLPADNHACLRWYTLTEDDLFRIGRRRKAENRLGFALQICALRFPGRLLRPGEVIPEAMLRVIADQVDADWRDIEGYGLRENTRYEHSAALQSELGYRPFLGAARAAMLRWLEQAALTASGGADLAEAFMAALRAEKIIAPAPSTFERLCARAMVEAERFVLRRIGGVLAPHHAAALAGLLEIEPGTRLTPLAGLRSPLGGSGVGDFRELVARVERVRGLGLPAVPADIPPRRLTALARECERVSVAHLREMNAARRNALLVAFMADCAARSTDAALDMATHLVGGLFKRAERRHLDALVENRRGISDVVRAHADLGEALIRARAEGDDLAAAIEATVGWEGLERSVEAATRLRTPISSDVLERIETEHPRLRRFAPLLLETFTFRAAPAAASLLSALARLRQGEARADAPMDFVTPRWRRLIRASGQFNRKLYELCVFARLRDALRAGDVWGEGSSKYRSFEERLLVPTGSVGAIAAGPAADILRLDPDSWVAERRERLDALLSAVERRAAADGLPDAAIHNGRLSVTPLKNATPDGARDLARRLYGLLPRVRITDLLEEVDAWTAMSDCFGHLRTGQPPPDRRALFAAIIADGLNLGLTRMAEACEGASYWRLARLVDWHIREDAYALATRTLLEAQERAPIAALWGEGATSSSDGQHFSAAGRARSISTTNPRYGVEPGMKFYTHVTDQFAPYATRAIAASAPEAPHVLDGLLQHRGRAPIREHHTDTGGFTDHVFALCALLGFRFAPRIRDLPEKRLYVFETSPAAPTLAPMVARYVRVAQLRAHWPQIVQLAASIRSGRVTAANAVSTLAATPRQGGLAAALAEIGRVERTIFMLEWMLHPDLRHRVQMGLNKGEARNNLARAVFFNRLGQLHDRTHENQQHRAAGCNLVVAAIILWNTVYLARAVETLRLARTDVPEDVLRHVWPLGWDHINLTGDYRWSADNPKSPDHLRPLRLEQLRLPAAA